MEKITVRAAGALTAVVAAGLVGFSHTAFLPAGIKNLLDTWQPQGAELVWSDLAPEDRTLPLDMVAGAAVRGVKKSPVYLLFVPRENSRYFSVILEARPSGATTTSPQLGYRAGSGSENNVLVTTTIQELPAGWLELRANNILLSDLSVERGVARRLVLQFPHTAGVVWEVRKLKIFYDSIPSDN